MFDAHDHVLHKNMNDLVERLRVALEYAESWADYHERLGRLHGARDLWRLIEDAST
jgi:hypothetical protein